jgi:hypothetical protein
MLNRSRVQGSRFRAQRFRVQRFRVQRFRIEKPQTARIKGIVSSSGYISVSTNGV